MFLRVLAEERRVGELHQARHFAYGYRRITQVVLQLSHRDLGDPLAGGFAAALLADLRQVLRRDEQLARVPLHLALMRVQLEQTGELPEGIIALVDRHTLELWRQTDGQLIHIVEHLHHRAARNDFQNLLAVVRRPILQLQLQQMELGKEKLLAGIGQGERRICFQILLLRVPVRLYAHVLVHDLLVQIRCNGHLLELQIRREVIRT